MMWLGFFIAYLGIGWDVCRRDRRDIIEAASDLEWRWDTSFPSASESYQVQVIDRAEVTVQIAARMVFWPLLLASRAVVAVWRRWIDGVVRRWQP